MRKSAHIQIFICSSSSICENCQHGSTVMDFYGIPQHDWGMLTNTEKHVGLMVYDTSNKTKLNRVKYVLILVYDAFQYV